MIGFMGCGKTTSGKRLAAALSCDFFDLDHQIAAVMGMSIPAYFEANGEAAFRILEKETLKSFPYPSDCVISTGGGTPCFFDNMEWMNVNGLTVYIDMPPIALAKRLEKGKHKRPLLKDLDQDGMLQFITEKLQDRLPDYNKARVIINGINLNVELLKNAVLNAPAK